VINYARKGTLSSVFQLGEIFGLMRDNMGNYVIAWLIGMAAGFLAAMVAGGISGIFSWIPFIGWIIGTAISGAGTTWSLWVSHYAYGLAEKEQPIANPSITRIG
jgi:hypothetical protein